MYVCIYKYLCMYICIYIGLRALYVKILYTTNYVVYMYMYTRARVCVCVCVCACVQVHIFLLHSFIDLFVHML